MTERNPNNPRGFGLLELMIYVALSLVVLGGVFKMLESSRKSFAGSEGRMTAQQNARVGADEVARELRMTGYYPENFDANAGNNLANVSAVQLATDNAIAILGDTDNSGTSSVFLFCLDGNVVRRKKGATGVAASYTCDGSGDTLAENVTSLRFGYFDANGAAVPNPATAPYQLDSQVLGAAPSFGTVTQRDSVRRVVFTLSVRQDVPGQATQIYTLTSDIRLRNLN